MKRLTIGGRIGMRCIKMIGIVVAPLLNAIRLPFVLGSPSVALA